MKIFDCFMYFDEEVVLDLRLHCLDKYVDHSFSNMTQQNRWEYKFFRQQLFSASVAGLPPVPIGPPLRHPPGFECL